MMYHIEQIYTNCLAQGAYYLLSEKEAAIIDPLRDVQSYLERLAKDGAKLKYIFQTHFHADFVSGHWELQRQTGAKIIFGPTANTEYTAKDHELFPLGDCMIQALHTPGHTPESTCFLLYDPQRKPTAVFTGDTLFIGDVGRPDLAQEKTQLTAEDLAGILYDSLREKIMPLPDDVIVYPAHGAGSACGKNMRKETFSTLGEQKNTNYALSKNIVKADFVRELTQGIPPAPAYFMMNVALNKNGYAPAAAPLICDVQEFATQIARPDVVVVDTRSATEFAQAHIPNAINIGLNGDFAPWAGTILADVRRPIALVTAQPKEAVMRLSRVGFDNVVGVLPDFEAWIAAQKPIARQVRIAPADFPARYAAADYTILDVRKPAEFEKAHLEKAISCPLAAIEEWSNKLDAQKPLYIYCAGGYRSMIAASILRKKGFQEIYEIEGGFNALCQVPNLGIKQGNCS